ncbi:fimbrial protein [Klebsiella pneumoniae]|nr:fimbrial protein [Klebsiella pneumoniae]
MGKPVYETGIDGIGFQFSDILSSKNGSIKPAIAESTIVPINDSNDDYKFMTVWLIKTKPVIDTSGTSTNPVFKFSAGNLNTNPRASDRLLLTAYLKFKSISYKDTSCDISVSGPSQITLNKIEKKYINVNCTRWYNTFTENHHNECFVPNRINWQQALLLV